MPALLSARPRPQAHRKHTLAADMGVSLRNLIARMGHDNEQAAFIYQHESSTADRQIADGLDPLLVQAETDAPGADGARSPRPR